jgi:hypothetical protein
LNLFDDNAPRRDSEQLMTLLDQLNAKDGKRNSVFRRAGNPATVADETRYVEPKVHDALF